MKRIFLFIGVLFLLSSVEAQKTYLLASPDGKINVKVYLDDNVAYQVLHETDLILDQSPVSLQLTDGRVFGKNAKLAKASTRTKNEVIDAVIYKRAKVKNHYNELNLKFKGDYSIVFRVYDDGVAYRFETTTKKPFYVASEQAEFVFPADQSTYIPYVRGDHSSLEPQFFNSFENTYTYDKLSDWDSKRLAFLPLLTEHASGKKVALLEADLFNYPGMYLHNENGSNTLKAVFAPHPQKVEQGGHNRLQGLVTSRENYIARFDGATVFPWRAIVIASTDKELADNDLVYKLATPAEGDFSWIKPGKVAWDWWNDWNLYGVDFRAGINNQTYKYYIDFASDKGIEYVILDEGWAENLQADLYRIVPEIDLKELVAYADSRNVGLILWAGYYALARDIEGICKHYSEMGIKGFKVDFMDRDDQPMVHFHYKTAETASRYKLLIDYHGTYKPTGLQRTFPNVINFEGVHGLEQMKWSPASVDQVTYDVTVPFIRQIAGPMDYTQGAMRNATKANYRPVNSEPMSQGTRCRQLAQYVVFESPLTMLCDNPSNYLQEPECTSFIAQIPTVWDETEALDGEVGKYIAVARRSGEEWYAGALTDWNARSVELDLSFLGAGKFKAEVFKDGINADRIARDYQREIIDIPSDRKLAVHLAPGGGFAMRIYPDR
jgi:Glycoside hydrolase 97.